MNSKRQWPLEKRISLFEQLSQSDTKSKGTRQPHLSECEAWERLQRKPFIRTIQVPAEVRKKKGFLNKSGTTDLPTLESQNDLEEMGHLLMVPGSFIKI